MDKKIGFIGCGNMGKAILGGLIASGKVAADHISVYTPSAEKVNALAGEYGINAAQSAQDIARDADIIFVAVKPNIILNVLADINTSLQKETLLVSVAAGVTLSQLATAVGHDRKIIRAMPNTPALVNAGMTSITPNALVAGDELAAGGRPGPFMALANVLALGIGDVRACVKVDDTVPGIEEGLRAGMWTVGLSLSGNEVGYSVQEFARAPEEEVEARVAVAEAKLKKTGAHYVVRSVADLPAVLEQIAAEMRAGRQPL